MQLVIRVFAPADEPAVIQLWRDCGLVVPWNDPAKDIARKLTVQRELFLVGEFDSAIVATVMAGYEGHRGWINYLAVHPAYRLRRFGEQMMAAAEERLLALGCPKINLQVRRTNAAVIAFYEKIGYTMDDAVSMGRRIIADP